MAGRHIPVSVAVVFTFVRPASVSQKRTQMVVRPDLDKLIRAVLDALTGVLYEDDSQVVEFDRPRKQYGTRERVEVRVRVLDPVATTLELPLVENF
jgi:crossover junction endodeoxyribonuclease RusA